jgi:hypothetical protein
VGCGDDGNGRFRQRADAGVDHTGEVGDVAARTHRGRHVEHVATGAEGRTRRIQENRLHVIS